MTAAYRYPDIEVMVGGHDFDAACTRDMRAVVDGELWLLRGLRLAFDEDDHVLATFRLPVDFLRVFEFDSAREEKDDISSDEHFRRAGVMPGRSSTPAIDLWFLGRPFLSAVSGCRVNGRMLPVQRPRVVMSARDEPALEFDIHVSGVRVGSPDREEAVHAG